MSRNIRAELIELTERELAEHLAEYETTTDPFWRDILAMWIEIDTEWLAETHGVDLQPALQPVLPLRLPIGLPAPGPWVGMAAK